MPKWVRRVESARSFVLDARSVSRLSTAAALGVRNEELFKQKRSGCFSQAHKSPIDAVCGQTLMDFSNSRDSFFYAGVKTLRQAAIVNLCAHSKMYLI